MSKPEEEANREVFDRMYEYLSGQGGDSPMGRIRPIAAPKTEAAPAQAFHRGDLVRVAKDLGSHMSHFTSDCDAIVIGSYADQFGGTNRHDFTLHLKGVGKCSWYGASQLTLVESSRMDLLAEWKAEETAERELKGDLEWIFSHGPEVLESAHPASVIALAGCIGLSESDLTGQSGEMIVYYQRAMIVIGFAAPFLRLRDLGAWLKACGKLNRSTGGA